MSPIDILLLLCFVPAIILGLIKGFISQAFGLVGLVLGVWLSFHFSEIVCEWLSTYLTGISDATLHIIGFAVILILVILLIAILGRLLKGMFKFAQLGWVDHLLGLVFGLCKALLIVGLVIILLDSINAHVPFVSQETLSQSKLYAPVRDITYQIFPYLKALLFKQ